MHKILQPKHQSFLFKLQISKIKYYPNFHAIQFALNFKCWTLLSWSIDNENFSRVVTYIFIILRGEKAKTLLSIDNSTTLNVERQEDKNYLRKVGWHFRKTLSSSDRIILPCYIGENSNRKHNRGWVASGIEVDDIDSVLSLWNYTEKLEQGCTMFSITFLFPHLLLTRLKFHKLLRITSHWPDLFVAV